jgi:MtN3 and saliva related transmembrane protein
VNHISSPGRLSQAEGISLGMFLVMVLGILLWLLYGLFSGDAPLIVANAITIVLAGGILFMKLKYR